MQDSAIPVLALWAAAALLALVDALLAPDDLRGASAAVYLATNVFVFFAALLLLAHAYAVVYHPHKDSFSSTKQGFLPIPTQREPHEHDDIMCCERKGSARLQNELTHVFLHVLCAAYVRTACGFEFRALLRG